jgi:hypothetical protein
MTATGPFGVDPLHFTGFLLICLFLFVVYLLLPKGVRVQYFGAYPKRYAWSARSSRGPASAIRGGRGTRAIGEDGNGGFGQQQTAHPLAGAIGMNQRMNSNGHGGFGGHKSLAAQGIGVSDGRSRGGYSNQDVALSFGGSNPHESHDSSHVQPRASPSDTSTHSSSSLPNNSSANNNSASPNDEIVISAAMQQLRDPGVLIIAHGSKGKPKTVRLQLTESAITWRTETRKKDPNNGNVVNNKIPPKLGKLHQVPLSHIMYVDVGKQTTALRRVENAHVMEELCFSLLTKEGSLDLEANSARERDALVSCFSLVLDEVHAANWRDIYRGPSSDMPSSFDDFDPAPHTMGSGMHSRGDSRV